MFRRINRWALCAGAVLVVGMVIAGAWSQTHKSMTWPQSHDHRDQPTDPGLPHVDVEHVGLIDFGFRTGHLVPVEIRVEMPANMTLETDINCSGDMKIVGRKDESERQKDGTTRYKLHLQLQSLMLKGNGAPPPQNAWVANITLMYRSGNEKPQPLKVTPIIVFPSKTYDDRKSKHAFEPELDWMPHHLTVTAIWLSLGACGLVWCVSYLWRTRVKRLPVVKQVPPPKPVDPWTLLERAYADVTTPIVNRLAMQALGNDAGNADPALTASSGDQVAELENSEQLRRSLALQIRHFYKLDRQVTWQEVSRRGQPLDSAIATILGACEESAVFGHYPLTAEDLPALETAHDVLLAAHRRELEAKANAKHLTSPLPENS